MNNVKGFTFDKSDKIRFIDVGRYTRIIIMILSNIQFHYLLTRVIIITFCLV